VIGAKRDFRLLYKGYNAAILTQVPYTVILFTTFEWLDKNVFGQNQMVFNKFDDSPFVMKFLSRFGAPTLSLLLAQTILYPFDTVKRCLQLNGSMGHKSLYSGSIANCFATLYKNEGIAKGFYSGFSLNLARVFPISVL